jgi:ribulose-5-phosphate 4-epimerase/fuculose-1-phosphate aldolase
MTAPANVLPIDRVDEQRLRIDLAAALRLAAHYDWHEGVANHFSAAVSPDIKNGTIVTHDRTYTADILIEGGKIAEIGPRT